MRRYGSDFADRQKAMFAAAGLPVADEIEKVPNSGRAMALGELARDRGVFDALHPRLFDAYWARGLDLGDEQVLLAEGTAAGLEPGEVEAAIDDPGYRERIQVNTQAVMELGAGGVPAWLVDRRLMIPGAQPHEMFDRVMERLGHAPVQE
jgi:predicted DsbA family dithiol-disulfide isomerase